jgi:tRNA threonylcarbamoyladenosine biosynthesis protein TsaE
MGRKRLKTPEETFALGKLLGENLPSGTILALSGDLGAGKTLLVQGIAHGLKIAEPVTSPTFVYLNIYTSGRIPLFHFDLYRLKSTADFEALGFAEYLGGEGIAAIEWPERISLPDTALHLSLSHETDNTRTVLASGNPNLLYLFPWD